MKINEDFLRQIGLDSLSREDKKSFLDYVYSELELRVGEELSKDMTPEQVGEFRKIANKNSSFILNWLAAFVPMYQSDEVFVNMQETTGLDVLDSKLLSEYASVKWLEFNCPNYAQIVAEQIKKLRQEIINNKDKLLENFQTN